MTGEAWTQLADFLVRLRARYRSPAIAPGEAQLAAIQTLSLGVAALQDLVFHLPDDRLRVPQVVVMGPTQAGKSTVVNLILQCDAAQPSPLAGFTRSLQGFAVNVAEADSGALRTLVSAGLEDRRTALTLEHLGTRDGGPLLVWDTPDFDSHASHAYRDLLPRVAGMADLLLLVLSREKYADLSVWAMLDLIRPLGIPLVLCLNKTDHPAELLGPLHTHLAEHGFDPGLVSVCPLPYVGGEKTLALSELPAADELRTTVTARLHRRERQERVTGARRLVDACWDGWVAPVREELAQGARWQQDINQLLEQAVTGYREQYLDHARYDNTFNRAVLRLLELLEIPGIAGAMTQLRRVLTWPLRRLRGVGAAGPQAAGGDAETGVLAELFDHLWLGIERRASDRAGDDHAGRWWRRLRDALPAAEEARHEFLSAVDAYQKAFQPQVEQAGQQLYDRLRDRPLTLNTLRAGRVSADAAGVLVALKTGAVGITEAVLTPAMLSLTSMLTESAVGRYVEGVRDDLRARQYREVEQLFEGLLRARLAAVPGEMDTAGMFNIHAEELAAADTARGALT